jgi:hypothetical protein
MARKERKDLLGRLADAGEDAIAKLGKAPGMDHMTGFANSTRDRLDELTKRVRGIDALEKRIARLENRVDQLSGTKGRSGAASSARKSPTRKSTTARKTGAGKGSTAKTGRPSPG